VSLAAELTANGLDAKATRGERGQFDVIADGRLVYSKKETGRFPEDGEVRRLLEAGS
jgi:selT/selW/selH-like putative selenoprotein